jgi:hypothetical protein
VARKQPELPRLFPYTFDQSSARTDDARIIERIALLHQQAAQPMPDAHQSSANRDEASRAERIASLHQQAAERGAGAASDLGVDKEGVLVAEPTSPVEIKAQQFVCFAVAAMREYVDAQDRLKVAAALQEDGTSATPLLP